MAIIGERFYNKCFLFHLVGYNIPRWRNKNVRVDIDIGLLRYLCLYFKKQFQNYFYH